MSRVETLILPQLEHVRRSGDGWTAQCPGPGHDDHNNSFSVRETSDGTILVKCFAGCAAEQIVSAIGLEMRDLFPPKERPASPKRGVTLAELAAAKGLPLELFRSFGWREENGHVVIPYRDEHGVETPRPHIRTARRAVDGSYWGGPKGAPIHTTYGAWRLEEFRPQKKLAICEGETDTLTLWYLKKPAIGVPGAEMLKLLRPELFHGFSHVLVFRDNDAKAGDKFSRGAAQRVHTAGVTKIQIIAPPEGCKDLNDWFRRNPAVFEQELKAAVTTTPDYIPPASSVDPHIAEVDTHEDEDESVVEVRPWPKPLSRVAYVGIFGAIVDALAPQTEADPAALLLQMMAMFGNVIGRTAHFPRRGRYALPQSVRRACWG